MYTLANNSNASSDSNRATVPATSQDFIQIADIIRLLHFAGRHRVRIVMCVLLAVTLAALYYVRTPRIYESMTELLVAQKRPLNVEGIPSSTLQRSNGILTHLAFISSPAMASRVIANPSVCRLATFDQEADPAFDPVAALIKSLTVVHQNKNEIHYSSDHHLVFSFRGRYADECPIVLAAVVDEYRKYLKELSRNDNEDALKLITTKADQIRAELKQKERDYKAFRETSPLLMNDKRESGMSQARLTSLNENIVSFQVRRAEISARVRALDAARKSGDRVTLRALVPERFGDREDHLLERQLLPSLVRDLAATANLGRRHPRARAVQNQIEFTRRYLTNPSVEMSPNDAVAKNKNEDQSTAEYRRSLVQELKDVQAAQEYLKSQLKADQAAAKEIAEYELKNEQYRNAMIRDQKYHDALINQLQRVDLDLVSSGHRVTMIAPPNLSRQVAPRGMLVFATAVCLGLIVGMTYAVSAEVRSRWPRGESQPAKIRQFPILQRLPWTEVDQKRGAWRINGVRARSDFCDCRPNSLGDRAYRDLRAAVFLRTRRQEVKTVLLTSSKSGDGKSTVTANLAASFARAGQRVLVVDANLNAPAVHDLFHVSNACGLTTTLSGQARLDDAILATGIDGLDVLPAGPRPPCSSDLLTSPAFSELLERVRNRFDYVLIDSPALLSSSDAVVIAAIVDGVLLATRVEPADNDDSTMLRAIELLSQAGANVLGLVVNEARPHGDRARPSVTELEGEPIGPN